MGVTEDLAPSFTQKPQLRQEDDGNRLIFQCQLVGSPKPEVTWFRGETQLTENDRTTFSVKEVAEVDAFGAVGALGADSK